MVKKASFDKESIENWNWDREGKEIIKFNEKISINLEKLIFFNQNACKYNKNL